MASARTRWSFTPNRLTTVLAALRTSGASLLDLTVSNPTRVDLPPAGDALRILQALANPAALTYEPEPLGLPIARNAVASYYAARGLTVDPTRLVLTSSTSEAYGWLFKLLCDPGDEVLVGHPSYPLFDDLARLEGVRLRSFPLVYEGSWQIDLKALRSSVGPQTRAIVLVHPNNPTGSYVTRGEQQALVALCRDYGLALVVDEVFGDYALAADPDRAPSFVSVDATLCFTLSGLSKVAALPQMKLGWIIVNGPEAVRADALQRLEMVADCYLSVGAPVQHAAALMLASAADVQRGILARVTHNLAALRARVAHRSAVSVLRVDGGWTAVLRLPRTRSEEDWCITLAEQDNVVVSPGYFYDFPSEAYLVISLLPTEHTFREAVERLIARVDAG